MAQYASGGRMKPTVFFPGMGSPTEHEIRRAEFDDMLQVRSVKKERLQ